MRRRSLILFMPTLAVSALAITFAASPSFAATQSKEQIAIQKEGLQLIGQVEDSARDIRFNADRLNALTRSTSSARPSGESPNVFSEP